MHLNAKAVGIDYDGKKPLDLSKLDKTDMVTYVGKGKTITDMNISKEKKEGTFSFTSGQGSNQKGESEGAEGARVSAVNSDAYFESNAFNSSPDDDKNEKLYGKEFSIVSNIAKTIVHETGHNALGDGIHPGTSMHMSGRYSTMSGLDFVPNLMSAGQSAVRYPMSQEPGSLKALPVDAALIQKRFPDSNTPNDNWSQRNGLKTIKQ